MLRPGVSLDCEMFPLGSGQPLAKARHGRSAAVCRALPLVVDYKPASLCPLKFGTTRNGEETVKSKIPAVLILCVFSVVPALAQSALSNAPVQAGSASFNFETINFPGATVTRALGLNNLGDIVGDYIDISNVRHGYLLHQGNFTSFDVPGSIQTKGIDINNFGVI